MAATMKDIAQMTGLSLATISKYLNGGNVLPKNKKAIDAAIKELNYTVNEFARGLKTNRSNTIGVIIPEINITFFMHIVTIMEDVLREENYAVMITDCRTDPVREAELVEFLVGKQVDGIVSFPISNSADYLKPAFDRDIPVVLVDRLIPELDGKVDSITINNAAVASQSIERLIDHGHRHIGIIAGPDNIYTAEQRLKGYLQAMSAHNLPVKDSYITRCGYSVEGGYQGLKEMLEAAPEMTAVCAANHETTLGALMALRDLEYSIPDDISFLGFDSMDWDKVFVPKLTMVEQPVEQIGKSAAEIMLRRLKNGTEEAHQALQLSARLHEGDSIRKITT